MIVDDLNPNPISFFSSNNSLNLAAKEEKSFMNNELY